MQAKVTWMYGKFIRKASEKYHDVPIHLLFKTSTYEKHSLIIALKTLSGNLWLNQYPEIVTLFLSFFTYQYTF